MKAKKKRKTGIDLNITEAQFNQDMRDHLESCAQSLDDPHLKALIKSCGVDPAILAKRIRKDKPKLTKP